MRIIYNRIPVERNACLSRFQCVFPTGTCTKEAISRLNLMAESYLEVQKNCKLNLLITQSFDRIKHNKLIEILQEIGIIIIRSIYWNGSTNYISIKQDVRLGCLLSLLLYNVYAEHMIKTSLRKIVCHSKLAIQVRSRTLTCSSRTTNIEVSRKMNTQPLLVQTTKIRKTSNLRNIMRHTESEQLQLILEGEV